MNIYLALSVLQSIPHKKKTKSKTLTTHMQTESLL